MLKREEIRIRDPFILTDKEAGCYYMYGTTNLHDGSLVAYPKFSVYKSYDLESFEEAKVIFDGESVVCLTRQSDVIQHLAQQAYVR